ncbi:MAG: hypothetical protein OXG24_06665 [Gammaproteobacteria bacterium]|nr:hypothetical protein [Gammaproteobacteria bacterium]
MDIEEAISVTEERLSEEGDSMRDLLTNFRDRISKILIGESQWQHILDCAGQLPIEMGAYPFGFELPLHEPLPDADFGASLASRSRAASRFLDGQRTDQTDWTAKFVASLFKKMDSPAASLREIVGRKLMLEYDIGSARLGQRLEPGLFLRPNEHPIVGDAGQVRDVRTVVDALVSSVDWERNDQERANVDRVYREQPEDTRIDSFGVFPSRSRSIRLAVMGFKTQDQVGEYLKAIEWPGHPSAVQSVLARFSERTSVSRIGMNVDVRESGVGPKLGLVLIVKQRYTKDSRYWLDGLTDWDPFLNALDQEEIVRPEKLKELKRWVSKPEILFAKTGRFVLMRGIHHIKLVVTSDRLMHAKAYIYLILSGALRL